MSKMPRLLDSCYAKLARADEAINNLDSEIILFLKAQSSSYEIITRFENDGRTYSFVAKGNPSVPIRFSVLVGEIFHNLRSALDHLICALVIQNGKNVSSSHQFPICTTALGFERACSGGALRGVTKSARELVVSVQPYQALHPDDDILQIIRQLNNLDKHQLPLITCAIARLTDKIEIANSSRETAITGLSAPKATTFTEAGTVVFSINLEVPDPQFVAYADLAFSVAFEKCGRVELAPVIKTMRGISRCAADTVGLFISEFDKIGQ